jgi:hypothetical protein
MELVDAVAVLRGPSAARLSGMGINNRTDNLPHLVPRQYFVLAVRSSNDFLILVAAILQKVRALARPLVFWNVDQPKGQTLVCHVRVTLMTRLKSKSVQSITQLEARQSKMHKVAMTGLGDGGQGWPGTEPREALGRESSTTRRQRPWVGPRWSLRRATALHTRQPRYVLRLAHGFKTEHDWGEASAVERRLDGATFSLLIHTLQTSVAMDD